MIDLARKLDEALLKLNLEITNANDAYLARAKATTERDDALHKLSRCMHTLALIAAPRRPDGSYNRDRQACEILARETLDAIK